MIFIRRISFGRSVLRICFGQETDSAAIIIITRGTVRTPSRIVSNVRPPRLPFFFFFASLSLRISGSVAFNRARPPSYSLGPVNTEPKRPGSTIAFSSTGNGRRNTIGKPFGFAAVRNSWSALDGDFRRNRSIRRRTDPVPFPAVRCSLALYVHKKRNVT